MFFLKLALLLCLSIPVTLASVRDYFPEGFFSSTNVTWAHKVHSKFQFESVLNDPSIHMLEATVVMGTLKGSTDVLIPVLSQPPSYRSDLDLLTFIRTVNDHNLYLRMEDRKGIKLNFVEPKAAWYGIQYVDAFTNHFVDQYPIFISANILPGPVDAPPDFMPNGTVLLWMQNTMIVEQSVLSLGWTTNFIEGGSYSMENVNQMVDMLKEERSRAHITFSFRAKLAFNSVENILTLLDGSGIEDMSPSVTLWEDETDPKVTPGELQEFLNRIGEDRVFVDLPSSF